MAGIDASIPLAALGQQHPIDPFSVAQSLSSMQLQRENAAVLQAQRLEATEKLRRANQDQTALDNAVKPGLSLDQVIAQLPGHLHATVREQFAKADSASAAARDARAKADTAEADYFGTLASSVKSYEKDGPQAMLNAANLAIAHAKQNGHDTSQIEQVLQQNPEALPQVLGSLMAASPKQRELANNERSTSNTIRNTDSEIASRNAALPGVIADAAVKQQVAAGTKNGLTPEQQAVEKDRAINRSVAQGNLSLAKSREQREQAKYDQTYGVGVSDTGQPLPENPRARAIAEYREPGMMGRAGTTGPGLALMQQVYKINPAYDASQFPARNKMRIAFTSGPQSQTLNSLNTAIEHLDQFADAAKDLGNGSFQPTNALKNWAKTIAGDSAPTNFEGIKTIMAGELASAFKKSGATDSEIEQVKASITGKQSPKQLTDYVTQIAIPALGSKAQTFQDQWRATMGEKDPFSVYTPGAQKVLQKHNAQPGGDTVKMRAPNGQTRDVASADVEHYKALGAVVIK